MNYAGPLNLSHWSDATADGVVSVDGADASLPHTGGAQTVIVNDANLLFSGDYKRSGSDLVLSKDGHDHVISDYFKGSLRAALSSPDGATLSPELVKALVSEVQLAQLGGGANAAAQVIGSVTKLTGSATAIRNGVSVMLNVGDNVQKGDVVQAGPDSSLGLTFIDGTVFGLSSNARMVLNEMVYDPNGSSNSSLLSLVQGTITFVAGETAKHGDMRVDTPVATMGIRGTAVLVEIGFEVTGANGVPVKFQVLVEPGGHVGSYFLYSKTNPNQIIGQVNQAGQVTSVTGTGDTSTGVADPLSPIAQGIIQQTLQQYFPNYVPNANPRGTGPSGGSAPADPNSGTAPDPLKFSPPPDGQPYTVPINLPGSGSDTPPINVTITRFNTAPTIVVAPVIVTLPVDKTSFDIKDQVQITDPDGGDLATPYVPGTAHVISATGPSGTPNSLDLKSLITVDPLTGHVSYDPAAFKFLPAGQKAVYTIGFDSQSGPDTTHETLTFTVDGTNDAPIVTAALTGAAIQTDGAKNFDLLAGASDADLGETATLAVGSIKFALNGGIAQAAAPNGVTLTGTVLHVDPSAFAYLGEGQSATITVTYNVVDAHGATVPQTETITIIGVNDQPTVVSTNFSVPQGGEVTLTETSFGISDPDANSDFTFTVTNVTGGTFVVDSNNLRMFRLAVFDDGASQTITFTMDDLRSGRVHFVSDGSGPPTFDLQVDDGSGAANSSSPVSRQTATYSDLAPVATPLTSAAHEGDCAVTVNLLTGASDPEHDNISIENIHYLIGESDSSELPAGFSLDGTLLTYDPANAAFNHLGAGETMTIVVSYDLVDTHGAKSTQTETITITGVNDRPVITSAAFTVDEGGIKVLCADDFGVTDPDNDTFTFTVSQVRHGKFQTSTDGIHWTNDTTFTSAELAAGHVRFVHDGSEGDASFSIKANDGSGTANSTSTTFSGTVDVTPVNDAPTLIAAPLLIAEGGTVVLTILNFLVLDPDSNKFTFTVSHVEHGIFQVKINGVWQNAPAGSAADTYTFTSDQLKAGQVRFIHDGGEIPPSYAVTADDGAQTNHVSNQVDSAVVFIPVNDAPKIVSSEATAHVTASGANIVHNGGFETGDFHDWAVTGNTGYTGVGTFEHSGSHAAYLGPIGSDGFLTQHIATTAGQSYVLDFWLQHDGGNGNDFSVSWNGVTLLSVNEAPGQPYTHYTYEVTATGNSTDLVFEYRQDPAYWNLDDVSVRASGLSASGTISFTDSDNNSGHTASYTMPHSGSGYIGNFALTPLTEAHGAGSVGWTFNVSAAAVSGLTNAATQSYNVIIDDHHNGTVTQQVDVSIGTNHADNFAFRPGFGTDVIANFTTSGNAADHLDLSAFHLTGSDLQQMLHENGNHDAVLDLGHGDSITFAGVTTDKLQPLLQGFVVHA